MKNKRTRELLAHILFVTLFLAGWEWLARAGAINVGFIGQPSRIANKMLAPKRLTAQPPPRHPPTIKNYDVG